MERLVAGGDKAVAALAARLAAPAQPPTPQRIGEWISGLESPDPHVREKLTCDLIQAGPAIEEPVRAALRGTVSAEARHRLAMALRDVTNKEQPGDARPAAQLRREQNCVRALQQINTPAAARQLTALAAGDPESTLTQSAKRALNASEPR
jgi:hypothetical protein